MFTITVELINDEETSDEEEAAIVIKTDKSKPVSHVAVD